MASLQYLKMSRCGLTSTEFCLNSINFLDFSNNPISDQHAGNLANLIAKSTNLESLDLSNCSLNSDGVHVVTIALQKL